MVVDLESARRIGLPVLVVHKTVAPPSRAFDALSPRERQVARLVAEGHRNESIALRLGVRLGTVKDHVHHVLTKTGLGSRTELAALVARAQL
jgi:DNA-binding NarL/FixJ family response regulator